MNIGVSGDTKIAVADGRNSVEIEKLVGFVVPAYCFNGNTIDICWSDTIRNIGKEEIYETVLDDGTSIFTTKDQEFLLRNSLHCKLANLRTNDSLMPLNKRIHNEGYILVNLNNRITKREHRLFLECKLGRPLLPFPGEVAHHMNENPSDNRWENLEVMSNTEHSSMHNSGEDHPMYGKHHTDKARATIRNGFQSMTLEERKKMGYKSYRSKILMQAKWMRDNGYPINQIFWNSHREKYCKEVGRKDGYWYKTAMKYFNTQEELIKALDDNHKVKEIFHVGTEDVYTLHNNVGNFAILTSNMSGIILRS